MALKDDGTVWAWGYNDYGQLGDNTDTTRYTPVQVLGPEGSGYLTNITAISAGINRSKAHKDDGTVCAWGRNLYGAFGDNTITNRYTPVQVLGPGGSGYLTNITAISTGNYHSTALKDDGTVWAWGYNFYGQLGDNTITNRYTPVQVLGPEGSGYLTNITAISAGSSHSMALKDDGTVWVWGYNDYGRLGDNTTTNRRTPVQVLGPGGSGYLTNITAISGASHSMALKDDGTVWAWGNNSNGKIGSEIIDIFRTPNKVIKGFYFDDLLTNITAISSGSSHSLALKDDGTVWVWGYNGNGQLGDNTTTTRIAPVQVLGPEGSGYLTNITAISASSDYSLAL
jgi:alpha-tubulin suppressor-like RCC1 family protein